MTFGWRTEPDAPARNRERLVLLAILLLAAGLRLRHIDFGLPSLNDPDEPVFIMTALDMLREGRLNPGWFGHPATLLFYLLVLVIAGVAAGGLALGRWAGTDGFVAAVFADPATIVLPMRLLMAGFGIASVWMTWRIGRRVGGAATGLTAALILAVNALHVELSQVIRTDVLATLLMGWAMLHALAIAERGRVRDHVLAGIAAGLACATKWPAMLVLVAPLATGLSQALADRRTARLLPLSPLVAAATLFAVSPYLLLDWPTVLRDLGSEARPLHPGATGFGFFGNLLWYATHPILDSFSPIGAALLAGGAILASRRRTAALVLLSTLALVWTALAAQSLVWSRWIVPLLPIMAILIALAIEWLLARYRDRGLRHVSRAAMLICLIAVMTATTLERQRIRSRDPRQAASAWVYAHLPPGRAILIEHAAFDLLPYSGTLLFPLGRAGCVDVRTMLKAQPTHRRVNELRERLPIVDVGHVQPAAVASCRADVLILSNYARYRREAPLFGRELAAYRQLVQGYKEVSTIRGSNVDRQPLEINILVRVAGRQQAS